MSHGPVVASQWEMGGNWDHQPFLSRNWNPFSHQFLMHRSIGKVYRTGSVWVFFVSPEQVSARENLVLEKLLCVIAKYCLIQSFVSNLSNLLHYKSQFWRDKCLPWELWTQKFSTVLRPCHPATWGSSGLPVTGRKEVTMITLWRLSWPWRIGWGRVCLE